jgi:hypothetical protein
MDIYRYQASSPAEAFEAASKDFKTWNFREMEALGQMAEAIRNGFKPQTKTGSGHNYFCEAGNFLLFDDGSPRGLGIMLVSLFGRENGIDDDAAQELLEHHRDRRGQELYAHELTDCSDHIESVADLDSAYQKLLEANLIERTESTVQVTVDGVQYERPTYVLR